ncbi:hypothetical protein IMZ48_14020 [Candidatus Bathyarchaeota archaeon]|nr:hypothetical protein [Candidatus Bathyarchaeota archaeon]
MPVTTSTSNLAGNVISGDGVHIFSLGLRFFPKPIHRYPPALVNPGPTPHASARDRPSHKSNNSSRGRSHTVASIARQHLPPRSTAFLPPGVILVDFSSTLGFLFQQPAKPQTLIRIARTV